jgi:DNA-binding IscR family transcriptional regulator
MRILRFMDSRPDEILRSQTIAKALGLPFEGTLKNLHRMTKIGILLTHRGRFGGFSLARPLSRTPLSDFFAFEPPLTPLDFHGFPAFFRLTQTLQSRLNDQLKDIPLSNLF